MKATLIMSLSLLCADGECERAPSFCLIEVAEVLARAVDMVGRESPWSLAEHSRITTAAAVQIGEAMGLPRPELENLYLASLLHDVGLISSRDRLALGRGLLSWEETVRHQEEGYLLLRGSPWMEPVAEVVRHHHDTWRGPNPCGLAGGDLPLLSRILHLANRVALLWRRHSPRQRELIRRHVARYRGRDYCPEVTDAFEEASRKDAFWFLLGEPGFDPLSLLRRVVGRGQCFYSVAELKDLARIFAGVVDRKSPHTRSHSLGVAAVARELGKRTGDFGSLDLDLLEVAGLLHDLGKLGTPEAVLDKPGPLDPEEWHVMRRHVFDTFSLLRSIPGLGKVTLWASCHHERLDGSGYPFGLSARNLGLGERVVAVADVFQAMSQGRPYRPELDENTILQRLSREAREGRLDGDLVALVAEDPETFFALARGPGEGFSESPSGPDDSVLDPVAIPDSGLPAEGLPGAGPAPPPLRGREPPGKGKKGKRVRLLPSPPPGEASSLPGGEGSSFAARSPASPSAGPERSRRESRTLRPRRRRHLPPG